MSEMTTSNESPVLEFEVAPKMPKKGLAVRCASSAVIAAPLDVVWCFVRNFTFPATLLPDIIESVAMQEGAASTQVGGVRVMRWKSGEEQKHQLLALDDLEHRISWEISSSLVPIEASAYISHIRCMPVTANKSTYIEWATDFSSDVDGDVVCFRQKANQKNLDDLATYFEGHGGKEQPNGKLPE